MVNLSTTNSGQFNQAKAHLATMIVNLTTKHSDQFNHYKYSILPAKIVVNLNTGNYQFDHGNIGEFNLY